MSDKEFDKIIGSSRKNAKKLEYQIFYFGFKFIYWLFIN